jgi:UDP-N-acetylglucosamine 4,6-dehydratase
MDQAIDMVLLAIKHDEGRCIFVPKIPSMKIIDLARAMAPAGHPIQHIGVRPGEKIHECLLSEDEGRFAIEYDKYFLVKPADPPVNTMPTGFSYTSNGNSEWIAAEFMMKAI